MKTHLQIKKNNYLCTHQFQYASVAELVDALDSKSCAFGRAGSIPARGTITERLSFLTAFPFLAPSKPLLVKIKSGANQKPVD